MSSGLIQEGPIGEFVDPVSTWNPKRDSKAATFRYVDLSSVDQGTKRIIPNGEIPIDDAPSRARQLLRTGDILVSTVRPYLNGVAFVPPELDGATASTGFCVLRPKSRKLFGRYLFHWVQTPQFVSDMDKKATGQSYPAVSDRKTSHAEHPAAR
jgi:type I restriction enzyme S subunit